MLVAMLPGATALTMIVLSPQSLESKRRNGGIAPLEPRVLRVLGIAEVIDHVR
jgi:hypothetical protein